jgi:transcriptional regulator of acetoin/glycerol metabolism
VRVAVTMSGGAALDLPHLPDTVRRALDGHGAPAVAGPAIQAAPAMMTLKDGGARSVDHPAEAPPRFGTPTKEELIELLTRYHGNITEVARQVGKKRMQVHRWLDRYNLDIKDFRPQ